MFKNSAFLRYLIGVSVIAVAVLVSGSQARAQTQTGITSNNTFGTQGTGTISLNNTGGTGNFTFYLSGSMRDPFRETGFFSSNNTPLFEFTANQYPSPTVSNDPNSRQPCHMSVGLSSNVHNDVNNYVQATAYISYWEGVGAVQKMEVIAYMTIPLTAGYTKTHYASHGAFKATASPGTQYKVQGRRGYPAGSPETTFATRGF